MLLRCSAVSKNPRELRVRALVARSSLGENGKGQRKRGSQEQTNLLEVYPYSTHARACTETVRALLTS